MGEQGGPRVHGIGGIFFKARDPAALGAWYEKHLGLKREDWGGRLRWRGRSANSTPPFRIGRWRRLRAISAFRTPSGPMAAAPLGRPAACAATICYWARPLRALSSCRKREIILF